MNARRRKALIGAVIVALLLFTGCNENRAATVGQKLGQIARAPLPVSKTQRKVAAVNPHLLAGMPPPLSSTDVYAADRTLDPSLLGVRPLIWVPNSGGHTVSVIDPTTFQVIRTIDVGKNPQHVVPSWDLKTLWVNNDLSNSLTPIDPATDQVGAAVAVHDPYNLYFTPDGKYAVVMASKDRQIVFRDAHTMAVHYALPAPCAGVNHADFSPDGRYMIVSCEFDGRMLKIDVAKERITDVLQLPGRAKPQDVKISPDGRTWYVADMMANGVWFLDGDHVKVTSFLPTGKGTHGLYVSRDDTKLYITNRGEGSISILDFATNKLVDRWTIPGGGSPDMGGLSLDGNVFWLSGRYSNVVYAIDTRNGRLLAKIPVGPGPHGLCVWPQPGRYSLGHTGVMR